MKRHRLERVAEVVREVAASTILFDLRDPRVKMVTVTRAEVSADLQHAKVYVSVMGSERQQQLALHGLQHAAGFVQAKLADRLQTRFTPVLTFVLDKGVKNALEVSRLIREARAEGGPAPTDQPGGPDGPPEDEGSADGPAAGPAP
ncbi:MAG TPA: 30S ribosome-binding factor RbfA [Gemmataceae bacterium]|jgi:ribosome-binding factor A